MVIALQIPVADKVSATLLFYSLLIEQSITCYSQKVKTCGRITRFLR